MRPCVVVIVSGGNVQGVCTDLPIPVITVDYDNIDEGDKAGIFGADAIDTLDEETRGHVEGVFAEEPSPLICDARESGRLFDQITGASYYGMHFRSVLMSDPEAHLGAILLERALLRAGVKGMDRPAEVVSG